MGPGEDADADGIHIFLNGDVHDFFRGTAQAGVYHLHAGITQSLGYKLRPNIVTVQPNLRYEDTNFVFHGNSSKVRNSLFVFSEDFFQNIGDLPDRGIGLDGGENGRDEIFPALGGLLHSG